MGPPDDAMSIPFFQFPGEIRNKIYEELLVVPEIIMIQGTIPDIPSLKEQLKSHKFPRGNYFFKLDLEIPRPRRVPSEPPDHHPLHPAILRANRATHHEAAPFLYSANRFQLGANSRGAHEPGLAHGIEHAYLASFLGQIGRGNAALLRRLRLGFPAWAATVGGRTAEWLHDTTRFYQAPGSATRASLEASRRTWALLRDRCGGLAAVDLTLEGPATVEGLEAARSLLAGMPSLKTVNVFMYEWGGDAAVEELMRGWGWTFEWLGQDEARATIAYWSILDVAQDTGLLELRRREDLFS